MMFEFDFLGAKFGKNNDNWVFNICKRMFEWLYLYQFGRI